VLKWVADEVVVDACRAIVACEPFVYPRGMSDHTRAQLARAREEGGRADILTPRELEVLKLVAEGHSSEEIAALLVISPRTVESHRANITAKLGARDRVELTRYAIRRGLVEP
jgi:DNA-binding NarL/FixJ family response regulator